MVKIIHCINLGERLDFSNLERACIDSWKKVYPDFEIKLWRDKDCIDWKNESKFASYHYYQTGCMAYVSDYIRCKILYEEGGLYLDNDVFALERIPDSYFEKAFTAWDVLGYSINNGTCFYAPEKKNILFKEFADEIDNGDVVVGLSNNAAAANARIVNVLLRKYDLSYKDNELCEKDIDLGDIRILNRSQFGGRRNENEGYITYGRDVYLSHACSGSWVIPAYSGYVELKYAVVDENTDMNKLKVRFYEVIKNRNVKNVFILFVSKYMEFDEELKGIIERAGEYMRVFIIPSENVRGCALDYMSHKISDMKITKDIMRDV